MTKKEKEVSLIALAEVYNAMQYDENLNAYVDGGRITISFTSEQMQLLLAAIKNLHGKVKR